MSRTKHSKDRLKRNTKNAAFIQKRLGWWGHEFVHKKKDRTYSRLLRTRLKLEDKREIGRYV